MSLDWKLQPRLAHRSHNPMFFLAISLLLHGTVFLGLELYWHRIVNNPLQTEPDELIPVNFIEVPANKLAVKPPLNAKYKASTNSRAGGDYNPELPIATGTLSVRRTTSLPSSQPRLTQSKSSTPQPSQLGDPVAFPGHKPVARDNTPNANRRAPGPQGVDAREDVNFGPYDDNLLRQVRAHWHPEVSSSSEPTIVYFSISRTGKVTDLQIVQPSGSEVADEAARYALWEANPVSPLPEGYQEAQRSYEIRFQSSSMSIEATTKR